MCPNELNVEIRRGVANDAAAIASILLRSFTEYQSLYTPAGFAATTPTSEQILERMQEGPLWVALHEGTIVGTVSAVVQDGSLYIRGMAVLPDARGLRLGELLLQEIQGFAAVMQIERLFLSTTPFLHRAIRLYQRFGFERTSDAPQDLFGTPLFVMEKLL
jgi:ribosomal protein S18 acetylase RimI-like enzyme